MEEDRGALFWTTITMAFVLLVHNGTEPLFLVAMALLPVLIFQFLYKKTLWPLAVYLIIFGLLGRYTRYFRQTYASDTLLAIQDHIGYFLAGKNVYEQVVMAQSGPTPFTYLPFSLFWYLPARLLTIDLRFFRNARFWSGSVISLVVWTHPKNVEAPAVYRGVASGIFQEFVFYRNRQLSLCLGVEYLGCTPRWIRYHGFTERNVVRANYGNGCYDHWAVEVFPAADNSRCVHRRIGEYARVSRNERVDDVCIFYVFSAADSVKCCVERW
ncbi:MAG: hypothetical protein AAB457_00040 [Patescibacteria group bacterium]